MAITWGAWSSNDRLRCGVEVTYSPSTITSATTSVTVTRKVYLQTRYASNETGSSATWFFSGSGADISGNTDWNLGDMGTILMASDAETLTLTYGASQTWSQTGKIHSYFAYPGTEATATQSITIPARPYAVPAAPSAAGAARVSDTSHTISWTRNVSTGAPYDNIYVERWDNVTNAYAAIATLAGTATSYSNSTTIADRKYEWRIRAKNSAGYSAYAYTGFIKTTPAPPGNPTATKTSGGDITVTWGSNSAIAEQIEVWHAANGVWDGAALATIAVGTSYTHVAPNAAQTHKYRLRSKIASPALTSAYTADSNTVQLITAPNAPTGISPTGVTIDATDPTHIIFTHNSVDTTPQRKKQIQYRVDGGAWVQPAAITNGSSFYDVAGGTWTNGHTIEYQVRTWGTATTGGSDGTGASPWSATSTLITSSAPTATINSPDGLTPVTTAAVTVTWGYFDAEGNPQAQWAATLFDSNGAVLETANGNGTQTSYTFNAAVKDGQSYSITVQVRDSVGALSDPSVQAFTVDYAPPPTPQAEAVWDEPSGTVSIEALVSAPGAGEVAAEKMRVFRSLDGGATWVLVGFEVDPGATVVDYIPPLNSDVLYKVQAVSATPSVADSASVTVHTDSTRLNRVWLNVGNGFGVSVFLSPECHIAVNPSASKELQTYEGREYAVEYASIARSNIIDVTGVIVRDDPEEIIMTSSWDEIEEAVLEYSAPACLRDLRGHRWFVSTNDPKWSGPHRKIQDVSYQCRVVDYKEPTYEEVIA